MDFTIIYIMIPVFSFIIPFLHCVWWTFKVASLALYMTWVHEEMLRRSKSWVPFKLISISQQVHGLKQSIWDYSAPPPNWRDDLS